MIGDGELAPFIPSITYFIPRNVKGEDGIRGCWVSRRRHPPLRRAWCWSCDWREDAAGREGWRNIVLHLQKTRDYLSSGLGRDRGGRDGGRGREERARGKRRAADSLLEGNTYYRFFGMKTVGYPGSNHDKCRDIHRRARNRALLAVCVRRLKRFSHDRTLGKLFPISLLSSPPFLPPPYVAAAVNLFARSKTGSATWRSRRNPRRRKVARA